MKSCPKYIQDAMEDYFKIKKYIRLLQRRLNMYNNSGSIDRDNKIETVRRRIKKKKKILNIAKKNICTSHIFIVPVFKQVYE